jgi:hypothetical protein
VYGGGGAQKGIRPTVDIIPPHGFAELAHSFPPLLTHVESAKNCLGDPFRVVRIHQHRPVLQFGSGSRKFTEDEYAALFNLGRTIFLSYQVHAVL